MPELLGFFDLDEFARETEDPLEELYIDLVHRLIETPGSNIDDRQRGVGITDRLSGVFDPSLARDIEIDFRKDDRVQACACVITEAETRGSYHIRIEVSATVGFVAMNFVTDGQGNLIPTKPEFMLPNIVG